MRFASFSQLPATHTCKTCGAEKPIEQIVVIHMRKSGDYLVRALCKECQNARERGHRREWKRNYLRRWRKYNAELNESYWRDANARDRETINARARLRVAKHHHALLIQGRLRRRLGMHVTLAEAKKLLRRFGPCYPTQSGLSPKGVRAVERIRSRMRNRGGAYPVTVIRLNHPEIKAGEIAIRKGHRIVQCPGQKQPGVKLASILGGMDLTLN
jgi:hypothetical protein